MMKTEPSIQVPLNASTFGDDEINEAIAVLRSGRITMGARCLAFEEAFADYMNTKNAVFVNSGSSANLLAFFAMANSQVPLRGQMRRLERGFEVIVPAVTWSTSIWPIVQAGGVPVLVDSDPDTLQMDLDQVEQAIGPDTVGICAVHVLGNAVPLQRLKHICEERHLWLIEDTCESLGTVHLHKKAGTWGDMGTYSFFFSHHITTIEGGMITTDDDDLAELLRCLRAHGWTRHLRNRAQVESRYPGIDPRFMFINTGFNVRPTEINAAFGLHQLKKLEGFNLRRVQIAAQWQNDLLPLTNQGLLQPMIPTPDTNPTWFGFPVICRDTDLRDRLKAHLESNGIETRPIICGNLARQPAFQTIPHRIAGSLSGADRVMDCGLFWGAHPLMTDHDTSYVTQTLRNFFEL